MPCAPARNAPGNHSLLDPVDSLSDDSARFSFSRLRRRYAARSPCPSLLASAVAAGFAARILGYGHRRRVIRVGESFAFQTSLFQLHPSAAQPPSVPSAFGCHPGTAAVIPAVIHARRAFGLLVNLPLPVEAFIALRAAFTVGTSRQFRLGVENQSLRPPHLRPAAPVENRKPGLTPAKRFPPRRLSRIRNNSAAHPSGESKIPTVTIRPKLRHQKGRYQAKPFPPVIPPRLVNRPLRSRYWSR